MREVTTQSLVFSWDPYLETSHSPRWTESKLKTKSQINLKTRRPFHWAMWSTWSPKNGSLVAVGRNKPSTCLHYSTENKEVWSDSMILKAFSISIWTSTLATMTFWNLSKKPTMTRMGTSTRTNFSLNSATNDFKLFILFPSLFELNYLKKKEQLKKRRFTKVTDFIKKGIHFVN